MERIPKTKPLVLSINSYVVHGYVGNKSIVFAIELHGINVDPLNLIQLSNHCGYPVAKGSALSESELKAIFDDLEKNEISPNITHVITGYIKEEFIFNEVENFLKKNPHVHYIFDPILGNSKGFYVPQNVLNFQQKLLPLAETIVPNSFEAKQITQLPMNNPIELLAIVKKLHSYGIKNVVIKNTDQLSKRYVFFSFENGNKQIVIEMPTISQKFCGAGDLFVGILVANMINLGNDFETIAIRTVSSVFAVLQRTKELEMSELALPMSVDQILNPKLIDKVIDVNEFLKC
ncbi:pyridoxal kinase [Histomonas meleagridis]|uniref:pyridoxal kinase n=1 Tax=Histomonas meleagridis TaxID=135588 RepID=UPI00355A68CB|nr:pyridoxal kinase [Histomonas meleagridis]KAH0806083.1 pyridoxal kinase [Histomonas meleagridis]